MTTFNEIVNNLVFPKAMGDHLNKCPVDLAAICWSKYGVELSFTADQECNYQLELNEAETKFFNETELYCDEIPSLYEIVHSVHDSRKFSSMAEIVAAFKLAFADHTADELSGLMDRVEYFVNNAKFTAA